MNTRQKMSHNYTLEVFACLLRSLRAGRRGNVFRGSWSAAVCFYPADHFKEICPAGHGYTYSRSDVQISLRQLEEDDLQSTGISWEEESPTYPQPPFSEPEQPSLQLPSEPQYPSYPQTPQIPQYPVYPETPQEPRYSHTPPPRQPQQPVHPSPDTKHPARETPRQPEGETKMFATVNPCQVDFKVDKCLF